MLHFWCPGDNSHILNPKYLSSGYESRFVVSDVGRRFAQTWIQQQSSVSPSFCLEVIMEMACSFESSFYVFILYSATATAHYAVHQS